MPTDTLDLSSPKREIDPFPRTLDIERALLTGVAHVTELLLIRHGEPEPVGTDEAATADPPLTELARNRHDSWRVAFTRSEESLASTPVRCGVLTRRQLPLGTSSTCRS